MDGQELLLNSANQKGTGSADSLSGQATARPPMTMTETSPVYSGTSGQQAASGLSGQATPRPPMTVDGVQSPTANAAQQTANGQTITLPNGQIVAMPSIAQYAPASNGATLPAGVTDHSPEIQAMYAAQLEGQIQSLINAYNQNYSTLEAAGNKIDDQYNAQNNAFATDFERTRRNNNMAADLSGLNTGGSSQMALAQQANYLSGSGQINAAQANAHKEHEQAMANLKTDLSNQISSALSQANYQLASALLQEANRIDSANQTASQQALQNAEIMASYGNFSGYASIYGQDIADNMQQFWVQTHPDYAYTNGLITANQYYQLTGTQAPGSTPPTQYVYVTKPESETPETPENLDPDGTFGGEHDDWVNGHKQ